MSVCKYCNSEGHTAFRCTRRPRKQMTAKKYIRKIGKQGSKWIETRKKWLELNKAPFYFCYYCNYMMTQGALTLDHKESRSRHPELRYKLDNLVPCCAPCNEAKGSLSAEEYLEKIKLRDM